MHKTKLVTALALGALALPILPGAASAQRAPAGGSAVLSALHPSNELGSGTLTGAGAELKLGLSSRVTLGLSNIWYLNASTEIPDARVYDLMVPSLNVRASMIGDDSDLALLMSAAAYRYSLDASGGAPSESLTIPALGVGAGVRIRLAGPLYLEFEGRDWISYVRPGELGSMRGETRTFSHTPDLRISLSALLKKREPVLATFDDLPLSYARSFRPVDATAVIRPPISETKGRDHVHVDRGEIAPLPQQPVPATPVVTPVQPMTKAVEAPHTVYDERRLGTIYFELGSHEVATSYRQLLGDVATFLAQNPEARLSIRGYTDPSGSIQSNLSLAERRGTTVQELLVRLYDVDGGRLDVISRGIDYRAEKAATARRAELWALLPAN